MASPNLSYRSVVGALTALYGATVLVRPQALLGPAALPATNDHLALTRAIGIRDVASGISLVVASPDQARAAVAARVAADLSDVVTFGVLCPTSTKVKAMGVAGAWAAVCLLAYPRGASSLREAPVRALTQAAQNISRG